MKISLISTLFLLVFSFNSNCQSTKKYQEIDSLIQTNNLIDAMNALDQLRVNHVKDTASSEYWLRYSKASYTYYKYEEAISAMKKAIRLSPSNSVY